MPTFAQRALLSAPLAASLCTWLAAQRVGIFRVSMVLVAGRSWSRAGPGRGRGASVPATGAAASSPRSSGIRNATSRGIVPASVRSRSTRRFRRIGAGPRLLLHRGQTSPSPPAPPAEAPSGHRTGGGRCRCGGGRARREVVRIRVVRARPRPHRTAGRGRVDWSAAPARIEPSPAPRCSGRCARSSTRSAIGGWCRPDAPRYDRAVGQDARWDRRRPRVGRERRSPGAGAAWNSMRTWPCQGAVRAGDRADGARPVDRRQHPDGVEACSCGTAPVSIGARIGTPQASSGPLAGAVSRAGVT